MATTKPNTAVVALDPGEGLIYDGFISYSHAADDLLAPRLQSGLQRFAKPWWKRRALRIFRDESSLSANPHLWSSITEALDRSDWFVLLLSPGAADSEWVNQEVEYWLEHKDRNRIIPVLTAGDFGWSDGDVAGDAPPALSGAFTDEPRWVDLRFARSDEQLDLNNASFRAAVADIASAIRQVPKDELESEEVRQHRRTRRTAWGAGAALLLLGVVATGAAVFALGQSNEAQTQRDEALRQTAIAEAQTDFAEEQQQEAESQAEIAQQERDRAELSALETIAASQIADSQTARVTNSALANLLAVEARQRIDIELTQANLARNTLSPASVRVTRIPPGVNAGDVGPDGSWSVLGYRATEARQSSAAPRPSGDAVGGYVEDFDGITQRPGNLRYDLPALPPNLSFADPGPWVDLSDDGSRLVLWYGITGPNRREAIVLDALTFEPVGDPIPGPISGVAINPEGSLLAVGSPGGEVPLGTIDLITATGEGVGSLPSGGHGQVDSFEFSGDGSRLFTQQFSSDEATVKVWDIAGQAMLFTKSLGPVFFSGAGAISQDGSYVAVATGGDPTSQGGASGLRQTPLQVTVLDAGSGAVVAEIRLDTFTGNSISIDFGDVEPMLAIGDPSGVSILSSETFDLVRRIHSAEGAERIVLFRDADRTLFAFGAFDEIARFDLTVKGTGSMALPVAGITSLSPFGDTVSVVESDGSVSFWSARSGEQIGSSDLSISEVGELDHSHGALSGMGGVPVFSADGALLYVRDRDGRFSVIEVSSGDVVGDVRLPVGRTHNALAVTASSDFVATGHSDGRVMLWDAESFGTTDEPLGAWQLFGDVGSCIRSTQPTFDGIRRLSVRQSISSLHLSVVDQCGMATTWEVVDGEPTSLAGFANSLALDFGPDESNLVSQLGTRFRLLADDGTEIRSFEGHREDIVQTSSSDDLSTIASVSGDMIGLWYTRTGQSLASGVTGAQAHIAGDGTFAVTSGGAGFDWFGGPVVVWDLDPDTWEEHACSAAGRNFSLFEWRQFYPDDAYRVTCPQWPSGLGG